MTLFVFINLSCNFILPFFLKDIQKELRVHKSRLWPRSYSRIGYRRSMVCHEPYSLSTWIKEILLRILYQQSRVVDGSDLITPKTLSRYSSLNCFIKRWIIFLLIELAQVILKKSLVVAILLSHCAPNKTGEFSSYGRTYYATFLPFI